MLVMLNPFAPHITEEMYNSLDYGILNEAEWVTYDEALCVDSTVEIVVQLCGKIKARINVPSNADKDELLKLAKEAIAQSLEGKTIALWGLSFKPETDDMRESTALVMIGLLLEAGCTVRAYDPVAMAECKRRIGDSISYCRDMYDAVLEADALLLLTEWKEFRLPTWGVIRKAMRRPLVIDGRNIFDSEELEENGFEYHCIGK